MNRLEILNVTGGYKYELDEMSFILTIAAITEEKDFTEKSYSELIDEYGKLVKIYAKTKEWLQQIDQVAK